MGLPTGPTQRHDAVRPAPAGIGPLLCLLPEMDSNPQPCDYLITLRLNVRRKHMTTAERLNTTYGRRAARLTARRKQGQREGMDLSYSDLAKINNRLRL